MAATNLYDGLDEALVRDMGGSAILVDAWHQFRDHRVVQPGASPGRAVGAEIEEWGTGGFEEVSCFQRADGATLRARPETC